VSSSQEILNVFCCEFDEEAGKPHVDAHIVGPQSDKYSQLKPNSALAVDRRHLRDQVYERKYGNDAESCQYGLLYGKKNRV
jgi:hypothetical protein